MSYFCLLNMKWNQDLSTENHPKLRIWKSSIKMEVFMLEKY